MESAPSFFDNRRDNQHIQRQVQQYLQDNGIDDQISKLVEYAFHEALSVKKISLSRLERKSMFDVILKDVVTNLISGLDQAGS